MVLVEIPLWVSHGTTEKKKSILPTTTDVKSTDESTDVKSAKDALSLLPNKAQQRHPMYGVDVHPDGTRFATASGDGTVKIWSTGGLFGGRFDKSSATSVNRKKKSMSKFTEGGNYVSSNSEGYDTASSLENDKQQQQPQVNNTVVQQQNVQPVGVNDLSGLVRRKKGKGGTAAKPISLETKPLTLTTATSNGATAANGTESNNNASAGQPASQQPSNMTQKQMKQHKLLTTISSSHTGSILAIRFSPSGTYLATAGDDTYINIYARSTSPTYKGNLVNVDSSGNKNEEDVEHWTRIAIGRGHALDVVGLAWAPDDSHLVSCSLDSVHPIIVWRLFDVLGTENQDGNTMMGNVTIHNLHPFKILGRNVHTSTVKGVTFDPAGKYIATSGDDPAICVWRAFDDWGLEARIDSSSGVFRSKKRKRKNNQDGDDEEDDPGELASLSMFRRISFAPDGSHVCGTNASLRGKHIAAMISREGWAASAPSGEGGKTNHPPGAANLVGHKQPVVCSRHCPVFFEAPRKNGEASDSEDDPDAEPEYATLVALGDKKGFVTVWSTKMSRPLFKMQCCESRCEVTDISWGFISGKHCSEGKDSLVMIVSLLDGFVVAINFTIPDEVGGGSILSASKQRQIFQLKYGIEDFAGMYGFSPEKRRGVKRLVDDAGPMLIENALQLTMEMENEAGESGGESSTPKAKKRGRPPGTRNVSDDDDGKKRTKSAQDPLQNALDAAARADATARSSGQKASGGPSGTQTSTNNQASSGRQAASTSGPVVNIPYVANKIYSVDLPLKSTSAPSTTTLDETPPKLVADVVNSPNTPGCLPSAVLTISRGGKREWRDLLAQVSCTALVASADLLAIGTADGCLLIYSTSPTLGWDCAKAFRVFPPFVLGSAVVNISFSTCSTETKMVAVTSDGGFYVYTFLPLGPKLDFKGSVVAPMQHLVLSCAPNTFTSPPQPKLARIQITETNRLMLILSFGTVSAKSLHGFVYNLDMEVWMKVSDSNTFLLSSLYTSTPRMACDDKEGLLSKMDRLVRSGASMESAKQMYIKLAENEKQTSQSIVTRAHCEDRLACAVALGSASEFQIWISSYAKCLSSSGDGDALRFLVDVLLGADDIETAENSSSPTPSCWWFSSITSSQCLGLNNKDIIRNKILPEMSKNRQLQRLTNEISMELS